MNDKNKSVVEDWARDLLRRDGQQVNEDEPVIFEFIPDDQIGSLAIYTRPNRRGQYPAYISVYDEDVVATLATLVEYARKQ
jgi:hypothetical protein